MRGSNAGAEAMTTIERPIQIQEMSRISAAAALRVYNFLNTRRTRRLNDLGLATGGSENVKRVPCSGNLQKRKAPRRT